MAARAGGSCAKGLLAEVLTEFGHRVSPGAWRAISMKCLHGHYPMVLYSPNQVLASLIVALLADHHDLSALLLGMVCGM